MQIKLIWAQAKDRVIGKNGTMPWHLPQDLAHFKRTTLGYPVIMGRKTWDSLPLKFRPLPGRMNVVISSHAETRKNLSQTGAIPAEDMHSALLICEQSGCSEVWVIGGAQIYAQALPLAHQVVVTDIDAAFEGDAFAPLLGDTWVLEQNQAHTSSNGLKYSFATYRKASQQLVTGH